MVDQPKNFYLRDRQRRIGGTLRLVWIRPE